MVWFGLVVLNVPLNTYIGNSETGIAHAIAVSLALWCQW